MLHCDGVQHCDDGSDEHACNYTGIEANRTTLLTTTAVKPKFHGGRFLIADDVARMTLMC